MKNILIIYILAIGIYSLPSCKEGAGTKCANATLSLTLCYLNLPPEQNMDSLKIMCIINGKKKYLEHGLYEFKDKNNQNRINIGSYEIAPLASEGVNTFYYYFSSSRIDTISAFAAKTEGCTLYKFYDVRCNGKPLRVRTDLDIYAYVVE